MKSVKNIDANSITVSFEGNDYLFPRDKAFLVGDALYKHLVEIYPLAFDFKYKPLKNEVMTAARSEKTKVYIKSKEENLKESSDAVFGIESDPNLSGKTDADGVNWYGGLEDDKV